MKKVRKLAGLLLALVMVMGLSVTASAASSITITGAQSGHTYTAYQIFSGTLSDGKLTGVGWGSDVTGTSLWNALQSDATIGSDFTGKTTAAEVAEVLTGYDDDSAKLIAFASVVADNLTGSGTASTYSDPDYVISGLDDGYYLVIDTSSSGLEAGDAYSRYIVKVVGENESVVTKTVYPDMTKIASDNSVEVGQTVTFTLNSNEVPDTTGYSEYVWKVTDSMSEGLTFQNDVVVKFGDTTMTEITTSSGELVYNDSGFVLTLDMTEYQSYKGQAIEITYSAVVNEKAVVVISDNEATLKYSNDPNDSNSTDEITDIVELYSAKIVIDKYDGTTNAKLPGAKFVLYKTGTGDTLYYKYDETNDVVSWVSSIDDATVKTTDANGSADFIGLEDGTYYLLETEAPDGYNKLSSAITVTINGSNATVNDTSSLTDTESIANKSGSALPSTGGMGTTVFYIIGGMLVFGAVVVLITRRRMRAE